MLSDAILKLETERGNNKDNEYTQYVGKYMVDYLNDHPDRAEKILAEGKTLSGSLKHMESVASKQKVGNFAVLSDDEGFKTVLEYYGIEEKVPQNDGNIKRKRKVDISLDDLL